MTGEASPVRRARTHDLSPDELAAIRRVLEEAFGPDEESFTEYDWEHALGGVHFVLELRGRIVSHASVVERELHLGGRPVRTGYVEAVGTSPAHQRKGYGSAVMREVGAHIRDNYELGALGTGEHAFYEGLGWETWRGPSYVRAPSGLRRTPAEDGYIMVLRTPQSPSVDVNEGISCDWRSGDVW